MTWPIRLRLMLILPWSCRWNAWLRDVTAAFERRAANSQASPQ